MQLKSITSHSHVFFSAALLLLLACSMPGAFGAGGGGGGSGGGGDGVISINGYAIPREKSDCSTKEQLFLASCAGDCMEDYENTPDAYRFRATDARDDKGTIIPSTFHGIEIKNSLTKMWKLWGPNRAPLPLTMLNFRINAMQEHGYYADLLPNTGYYVSDVDMYIHSKHAMKELAGLLTSPDHVAPAAAAQQQSAMTSGGNAMGEVTRDQSSSAIGYCAQYINNFTATENIWTQMRQQLFVPIAVLLLLPGALLCQVRSIAAAGSPVLAEVVNPFEGILRAIVCMFMIPATALVVNYGIDLSNSITYTIASEYQRITGKDMYKLATAAEVRGTPIRAPQSNIQHYDQETAPMGSQHFTNANGPFSSFELRDMANSLEDPDLQLNQAPENLTDESLPAGAVLSRLMMNATNAGLASTWNILCAFQLAYLYYLWMVGPIMAALWVYPIKTLRNALPSWIEGVITLCFWSLFWNTVILVMATFKGVDESGTVLTTALNFLATASVKYAFDFASLVKNGGAEAAGMAMSAAQQGGGAAAPPAPSQNAASRGRSAHPTSARATGMQVGGNGNRDRQGSGATGALLSGKGTGALAGSVQGGGGGARRGGGSVSSDLFHNQVDSLLTLAAMRQSDNKGGFVPVGLPPSHAGVAPDLLRQAGIAAFNHSQMHLDHFGHLIDAHGHSLTAVAFDHNGRLMLDANGHPLVFDNGNLVNANGDIVGSGNDYRFAFFNDVTGEMVGVGMLLDDGNGSYVVDAEDGAPGESFVSTTYVSDEIPTVADDDSDNIPINFVGDDDNNTNSVVASYDPNGNLLVPGELGGVAKALADWSPPPPPSHPEAIAAAKEHAEKLAMLNSETHQNASLQRLAAMLGTSTATLASIVSMANSGMLSGSSSRTTVADAVIARAGNLNAPTSTFQPVNLTSNNSSGPRLTTEDYLRLQRTLSPDALKAIVANSGVTAATALTPLSANSNKNSLLRDSNAPISVANTGPVANANPEFNKVVPLTNISSNGNSTTGNAGNTVLPLPSKDPNFTPVSPNNRAPGETVAMRSGITSVPTGDAPAVTMPTTGRDQLNKPASDMPQGVNAPVGAKGNVSGGNGDFVASSVGPVSVFDQKSTGYVDSPVVGLGANNNTKDLSKVGTTGGGNIVDSSAALSTPAAPANLNGLSKQTASVDGSSTAMNLPTKSANLVANTGTAVPTGSSQTAKLDSPAGQGSGQVGQTSARPAQSSGDIIHSSAFSGNSSNSNSAKYASVALSPQSIEGGAISTGSGNVVNNGSGSNSYNPGQVSTSSTYAAKPPMIDNSSSSWNASGDSGATQAQAFTSIVDLGSGVGGGTSSHSVSQGDTTYTTEQGDITYTTQGAMGGDVTYTTYGGSSSDASSVPLQGILQSATSTYATYGNSPTKVPLGDGSTEPPRSIGGSAKNNTNGTAPQLPSPRADVTYPGPHFVRSDGGTVSSTGRSQVTNSWPSPPPQAKYEAAPEAVPETQIVSAKQPKVKPQLIEGDDSLNTIFGLPIVSKDELSGNSSSAKAPTERKVEADQQRPQVSVLKPSPNRLTSAMGPGMTAKRPAPPPLAGTPTVVQPARGPQPPSNHTSGGAAGDYTPPEEHARHASADAEEQVVLESMPDSLQTHVDSLQRGGGRITNNDEEYEAYMKAQLDQLTSTNNGGNTSV